MQQRGIMLKVLSPVESNGRTFWMRIGNAFINRDGSTNVYLNAYPTSGKLQIRPLDERDYSPRGDDSRADALRDEPIAGDAADLREQDELPF